MPNKLSWQMRLRLEEKGFDPVAEFIAAYGELEAPDAKIQALLALFAHCYPKLNSVDAPVEEPTHEEHTSERSTEALLALAEKV